LVERIALDLDQLDLDETVEKVKAELNDDNSDSFGLVQALAHINPIISSRSKFLKYISRFEKQPLKDTDWVKCHL